MHAIPLPSVYRAEPWANGPARVYARLAVALLARCPLPLRGALLLDAGAGTGAVSAGAVAVAAGARVVATDIALDMLLQRRHRRGAAGASRRSGRPRVRGGGEEGTPRPCRLCTPRRGRRRGGPRRPILTHHTSAPWISWTV
ncbi:MAG TPA: hypothetical protein VGE42_12705 [Candidatus Dormibacteraeota bacterium]